VSESERQRESDKQRDRECVYINISTHHFLETKQSRFKYRLFMLMRERKGERKGERKRERERERESE